jgi:hypothetical protein
LGATIAVQLAVPLSTAAGQDARPNACVLVDAAQVTRISGETDMPGEGPASVDEDLGNPKNRSVCMFAGFIFELTTNVTPESFARSRRSTAPDRFKVESIPGLGDEAYYLWDMRPGAGVRSVLINARVGSKRVAIEKQTTSDSIDVVKKWLVPMARMMVSRAK